MTEYEMWEVFNALVANLMTQQTLFIGSFTGYVVAAHWVGKNLSTYQIAFLSAVFIVLALLGIQSQLFLLGQIESFASQLSLGPDVAKGGNQWISIGFVMARLALIIGALIYMWTVRHPKTE